MIVKQIFTEIKSAPYDKKIGPDPSSIDSCMIGGIVYNNSSGMCCGVAQNTYNTIKDLRLIFADGTVLDTSDPESKRAFARSHGYLLEGLSKLAERVKSNPDLVAKIKRKYSIKNTMGYSINAFVDFEDPFEILKHIIVGSEGTLGFIGIALFFLFFSCYSLFSCLFSLSSFFSLFLLFRSVLLMIGIR